MNNIYKIIVQDYESNIRIDKFISLKLDFISRTLVQKLLKNNNIFLNFKNDFNKNCRVNTGDIIQVNIPEINKINLKPEKISLNIPYEDEDLLIVNKPQGMVVHPSPGHYSGTLVNALLFHCGNSLSGINGEARPGIVHRIDKDTSGLLIVAKNDFSHQHLARQIKNHTFAREYEALVHGTFVEKQGKIIAPIGRDIKNRKKMCVTNKNSKTAITEYKILKEFSDISHIRLKLYTGRTHQIRVHMAYLKHPVIGDPVYGFSREIDKKFNGQCLHAKLIGFIHPRSNKYLEIESDLPDYFNLEPVQKKYFGI